MGTLKRRKCNTQWWKLWERVWVCHRAPYSLLHTLLAFKQCHINYIGHRRKCEIKNVYYIIYSKRWFSNKSVPLDISALHISDLMPVVWLMLHSWMLNSFIAQFNHILSKQVQGTAAWRRCLALTFPPDVLSHPAVEFLLHGSHSSALGQAGSPEAHLQEEIIFHCSLNTATLASLASSPSC